MNRNFHTGRGAVRSVYSIFASEYDASGRTQVMRMNFSTPTDSIRRENSPLSVLAK